MALANARQCRTEFNGKYKWSPLIGHEAIGLLELHPGPNRDRLRGSLIHTSLRAVEGSHWEALSYVWGQDARTYTLHTNQGTIGITASLHEALMHLRLPTERYRIWIDAICIDQENPDEKSQQVKLMGKIYESASCTVVFLGSGAEVSKLAHDTLLRLSLPEGLDVQGRKELRYGDSTFSLDEPRTEQDRRIAWTAVTRLLLQPWFKRVWIIQEFVLAREVVFVYGDTHFDWTVLEQLSRQDRLARLGQLYSLTDSMYTHESDVQPENLFKDPEITLVLELIQLMTEWRRYRTSERVAGQAVVGSELQNVVIPAERVLCPILYVLAACRRSNSTLDHDHLFAMRGLAYDVEDGAMDPDYRATFATTLRTWGEILLVRNHGAHLLSQAAYQPERPELPSWVPDWSTNETALGQLEFFGEWKVGKGRILEFIPTFRAGGDTTLDVVYHKDDDILQVVGSFFAAVSDLGTRPGSSRSMPHYSRIDESFHSSSTVMRRAALTSYPTGEDLTEVQWRTLVANRTEDYTVPSQAFAAPALRLISLLESGRLEREPHRSKEVSNFAAALAAWNKRFFVKENGYVGLAPLNTEQGDLIFIPFGNSVPLILRRCEKNIDRVRIIGSCYVHGIMDGEGIGAAEQISIY